MSDTKSPGSARPLVWTLICSFGMVAVLVLAGIWYTHHEIGVNNAKWCDLLTTLDSPIPPDTTNPRSVGIAAKLHTLKISFDC
jgi:hypothetical protein